MQGKYIAIFITMIGVLGFVGCTRNPVSPTDLSVEDSSVLSSSITKVENAISIDFESCVKGSQSFAVAFGSTAMKLEPKDSSTCLLSYGSSIENPKAEQIKLNNCSVPRTRGKVSFLETNYGFNMESISQYCDR